MARPITVVLGGLAAADPNGAVVSQARAAAGYLALSGALTNGQTANNVALSQQPGGAGAVLLNGTLVTGGVAYLGSNNRIYITSGSDISNRTFTITGVALTGGGLVGVTETLTGPNATIVASQQLYYSISSITISGAAAGALTIGRAGVATFDSARRVAIDSDGDDSLLTFTLVGTDVNGTAQTETLAGANAGVATSLLSFKTLTSVYASGAVTTTLEVGTSAVADSQFVFFGTYASNAQVSIQCTVVSGSVNYTVQQTLDNPTDLTSPIYGDASEMAWVDHPSAALVGASSTQQGNYAYPPAFAKVVINSGDGSVRATFTQAYMN